MKIDVLTLFPDMIKQALSYSMPSRAVEKGAIEVNPVFLRDFAIDNRGTVDDTPAGGGPGMVLRVDVADKAFKQIDPDHRAHRIMLSPDGKQFDQKMAKELSQKDHVIILCGRYEGFDARIEKYCDEKVSIGNFVLSGGEPAAIVMIDALARLIPGVLGNPESLKHETFEDDLTDYPVYTRPVEYDGQSIPEVLLSGNHQQIEKWRESFRHTTKPISD